MYKAHAFLSTGTAVDGWRRQVMTKPMKGRSWAPLGVGVLAAVSSSAICVAVLRHFVGWSPSSDLSVLLLPIILSLSAVPLLTRGTAGVVSTAAIAARVSGIVVLYILWHAAATRVFPNHVHASNTLGSVLVGVGFVGLFVVNATLHMRPDGRLAHALHPWLFAGLYLDERFTRLTFRVWPPRLQKPPERRREIHLQEPIEART